MNKIIVKSLMLALVCAFAFSACQKKGSGEKVGEKIDEVVDDAGDAIEDATDK